MQMRKATDANQDADAIFASVAAYFGVLAQPMRLKILGALCRGEKSVQQVMDDVNGNQANVSKHLKVLHDAGIIARRKQANQVMYAIADQSSTELCRSVCVRIAGQLDDSAAMRTQLQNVSENFVA